MGNHVENTDDLERYPFEADEVSQQAHHYEDNHLQISALTISSRRYSDETKENYSFQSMEVSDI